MTKEKRTLQLLNKQGLDFEYPYDTEVLSVIKEIIINHILLKEKVKEYLKAKLNFETHKNNNEVSADYYFEYQEQEQELKVMMSDE